MCLIWRWRISQGNGKSTAYWWLISYRAWSCDCLDSLSLVGSCWWKTLCHKIDKKILLIKLKPSDIIKTQIPQIHLLYTSSIMYFQKIYFFWIDFTYDLNGILSVIIRCFWHRFNTINWEKGINQRYNKFNWQKKENGKILSWRKQSISRELVFQWKDLGGNLRYCH